MSNQKAVSNEQIISAILTHGTFEAAAESLGISSKTIQNRMKDPDFRAAYMNARNDVMRDTVQHLNNELGQAVSVISEIMNNRELSPSVRLSAASMIIKNAFELSDALEKNERRTRDENKTLQEKTAELFY